MRKYQIGSFTVEAAMGIPIFILVVLTWIEICVAIYSISMSDHALTQAVSATKKTISDGSSVKYNQLVENKLKEQAGFLWSHVMKPGTYKLEVEYLPSYSDLVNCSAIDIKKKSSGSACSNFSQKSHDKAIAIYSLGFDYSPVVSVWFPELTIKREIIVIQEHERSKYRIR
ncbi:TadE family protein [Vibrio pectenicida]|uniref:Pilus assembly protein n=1 Tax=Vibrio pectenicida TaxID=62763 RepID=A0A3R9E6X9_9VIBR|nr:TadE family protein [Vibrio pectenicida]RSD27493.1 pilus assembly protein [Vibrio pectenicida]